MCHHDTEHLGQSVSAPLEAKHHKDGEDTLKVYDDVNNAVYTMKDAGYH